MLPPPVPLRFRSHLFGGPAQPAPFAQKQIFKMVEVDRLNQVVAEASLVAEPSMGLVRPAGKGDQQCCREFCLLSKLPCHLAAIHFRHRQIQQYDVGSLNKRHLEGFLAIVGHLHIGSPKIHHHGQAVGGILVVIDDQHAEYPLSVRNVQN